MELADVEVGRALAKAVCQSKKVVIGKTRRWGMTLSETVVPLAGVIFYSVCFVLILDLC